MEKQPRRPEMSYQEKVERDMYVADKSLTPRSAEVQFGPHRIFVNFREDGQPVISDVIPNRVLNSVERDAAVDIARKSINAHFGVQGGAHGEAPRP